MRKFSGVILTAALALALGGVLLGINLNPALAQSVIWQAFCAGQVQVNQQSGGYQVMCYSASATATPVSPTATPVSPSATPGSPPSGSIIVDHNSVAQFDRIPAQYLTAARNLRVVFMDRSVGQNFNEALNCLAAGSFGTSPVYCRRHWDSATTYKTYTQADYDAGRVPDVIRFTPNATTYNRNNWVYDIADGTWSQATCTFIQTKGPAHLDKNVLSYQINYMMLQSGSGVMRFWNNNPNECDIYDLEAFMAQHPDKTFVFWTASLARSIGTQEAQDFNTRMRQYARDNNRILFDFAAIESYTPSGQPCYDNRDGVAYADLSGASENYPNDNLNLSAICKDYTTEVDGGHLGTVSGARIRAAKAWWVLMARIAGWRP